VSGFCKTHIKDRTLAELEAQRVNDMGLLRVYSSNGQKYGAAKKRISRIEGELKARAVSAPVSSPYEPENTEPRT